MEDELVNLQVRAEIDQANADHLHLADECALTLPGILYAIGIVLSGAGALIGYGLTLRTIVVSCVLMVAGVALIRLSYKLKRRKLEAARRHNAGWAQEPTLRKAGARIVERRTTIYAVTVIPPGTSTGLLRRP